MNCYLRLPCNKRAQITLENQGENPWQQFFYIEYELYKDPLPHDTLHFRASWKRQNPTKGWAPKMMQVNSTEIQMAKNLDGRNNHVILEAEGEGNYIGCNHSVTHFQNVWWGEGDDMIWIDDDPQWPPSLHGTGSEDYFNQGWMMQKNAYPFSGSIVHETQMPQQQVSYRFHITDPVRFAKRIKVTLETGHANHLCDDVSTTAYWYQTLPGPKLSILGADERLPRRAEISEVGIPEPDLSGLDPAKQELVRQRNERYESEKAAWQARIDGRAVDTKLRVKKNVELAAEVRSRWLSSLQ